MDILGRVYEYFLTQFASAEGKNGGQFYTPSCVVRVLVEMLAPCKGRIYDPCGGSGGMFVQSEKFVEAHGGKIGDITIYGQESNSTTRRLAVMNLALRGIEADLMRPDDMLETFSELAVKEPDLLRLVLQASVAALVNAQSVGAGKAEMKRRAVGKIHLLVWRNR